MLARRPVLLVSILLTTSVGPVHGRNKFILGMEPKGQPNEQMEEVVLQPTQPKLVSFCFILESLMAYY